MENINIIKNLGMVSSKGFIENYHLIIVDSIFYIVNTSNDYSKIVDKLFFGIGEAVGLIDGAIGFLGGILVGKSGDAIGDFISKFSHKRDEKKLLKIIDNLEELSNESKNVTKVSFESIRSIVLKKSFIINGSASIQIHTLEKQFKFDETNNKTITELKSLLKDKHPEIKIKTVLL